MQVVTPNMMPLGSLIIMLLAFIGICGLWMLFLAFENYRKSGSIKLRIVLLIFGFSSMGIVAYNWIGYHQIIRVNEVQIIGEFQSEDRKVKLIVNEDHTWKMYSDSFPFDQSGSWDYFMSENLDIWEFMIFGEENTAAQTQSPDSIDFEQLNRQFHRIE